MLPVKYLNHLPGRQAVSRKLLFIIGIDQERRDLGT